jgi:hypothetical protein
MKQRMRELMLWLSAADLDVLARCPGDAARFVAAGGAVLTTAAMAALAGAFTAHTLLHLGIFPALLMGAGWGIAIMNLERLVQSSIRRQRTWQLTLLQALPRLGLALMLGLVISTPLLLQIFQNEIKAQVAIDKNAQRSAAHKELLGQFAEVPKLRSLISSLETAVSTPFAVGRVLETSPEYHTLARRYGIALSQARNAATSQAAHHFERAARGVLAEMEPLRSSLLTQEAQDNRSARASQQQQLAAARQRLAPIQAELQAKDGEVKSRFNARSGLADQIEALGKLEQRRTVVATEKTVLLLFILTVDLLPALMKVLLSIGRRSVYEEEQDEMEHTLVANVRSNQAWRREQAERAVDEARQIAREVGQARVAKQIEAQKEIDTISIDILRKTVRPNVERWAKATAERYARGLVDDMSSESGSPFPPGSRRRAAQKRKSRDRSTWAPGAPRSKRGSRSA